MIYVALVLAVLVFFLNPRGWLLWLTVAAVFLIIGRELRR